MNLMPSVKELYKGQNGLTAVFICIISSPLFSNTFKAVSEMSEHYRI